MARLYQYALPRSLQGNPRIGTVEAPTARAAKIKVVRALGGTMFDLWHTKVRWIR